MRYNLSLAIFIATLRFNEGLRILVFFPISSQSHSILGLAAVGHLLKAGHEVVHITSFPSNIVHVNYTKKIDVSEVCREVKSATLNINGRYTIGALAKSKLDEIYALDFVYESHRRILDVPEIQNLFGDPNEKFDVVLADWIFSNYITGLGPLFQSPLIWLGTNEAHWQILHLVDEIPSPAVYVDVFSSNAPPFNFWQRIEELYIFIKRNIQLSLYITPKEKASYYAQFGAMAGKRGVVMPKYEDALYNASMILLNSHPTIGTAYSLPQSAKFIAGFHISDEIPALPKEFQRIMDDSKHGVIYFSMGSNLRSADMSEFMKKSLMDSFSKLNETVIWKLESDYENVPNNVHLVKWAPQQSILAHPNLKFFITHGGQLSTIEAIHFGIPLIGIPIIGDQFVNMNNMRAKGFGIRVELTEDRLAFDLLAAINEINNNPKYRLTAKEISEAYHMRLRKPGDELVFWVEYVAKTRGALHLRSPTLLVPFYKKLYLDLIALILICHYVLKRYVWVTFKVRCTKLFGKKKLQ